MEIKIYFLQNETKGGHQSLHTIFTASHQHHIVCFSLE